MQESPIAASNGEKMDGTSPVEIALGTLTLVILALGFVARRYPEQRWLRPFDLRRGLPAERRQRLQRTVNLNAGVQLILLGIMLPLGYLLLETMTASDHTRGEIFVVMAASLVSIIAGSIAVARTLRS